MTIENTSVIRGVKARTIATLIAIACSVALPQVVHAIGAFSGTGSLLGEILLPMHIAVLAVGFLAGPVSGLIAGVLSPILSFALSGMPILSVLPFMAVELAFYGLVSGLLANVRLPAVVRLLIAQLCGRLARSLVVFACTLNFGSALAVFTSVVAGLPGIILQLVLIPAALSLACRSSK